jgi:anti-sigma factor RsiW
MALPNRQCNASLLHRFLDNDLEPEAEKTLEQHLLVCGPCKAEIERMRMFREQTRHMIAAKQSATDQAALSESIMAAVHRKRRPALSDPSWWFRPPRIIFASATAVMAMLVLFYTGPFYESPLDEPSAIVHSFRAETASVMIWETPKNHQTIIWFDEKT